jgi:hypothetical protein
MMCRQEDLEPGIIDGGFRHTIAKELFFINLIILLNYSFIFATHLKVRMIFSYSTYTTPFTMTMTPWGVI